MKKIKRALLSVSDKRKIVWLARELKKLDMEIIATSKTAKLLKENGIPVKDVSEITGFPEMLDNKVKTLHPALHAGVQAHPANDADVLEKHGIKPIGLAVVNFYTDAKTIDVGGPALAMSAIKNWRQVLIATNPNQYERIIELLKKGAPENKRRELARQALIYVSDYYKAALNHFNK